MGNFLLQDCPKPLNRIESGAVKLLLVQIDAASLPREEGKDIVLFVACSVASDDMNNASIKAAFLEVAAQI